MDILRGVFGFAAVTVVVLALRTIAAGENAIQSTTDQIRAYVISQRALFACIGLIAAFGEESIFRGYLQPLLARRLGLAGGVLVTAAIFAAYHLQFGPVRLLSLFLIGLIYGVLRGQGRSLVAPAAAHGLCWAVLGLL